MPPGLEAPAGLDHPAVESRDAIEHDERRGRGERISHVRVRVDVLRSEIPRGPVLGAHEARGDWEPTAQRFPAGDEVGHVAAPPECAGPPEAGVDLVRDEERTGLVAALAQPLEKAVRRDVSPGTALDGLDDDARRVRRERARIIPVWAPVYRPWEPGSERALDLLESRGRKREQAGPRGRCP